MDEYYKVTNTSDAVITWNWVTGLLTPKEKAQYESFKQSEDFIGKTEEEKQAKKKIPEAVRAKIFFVRRGKGMPFEEFYNRNGSNEMEMVLKWYLAPNYDVIRKDEAGIYKARDLCLKYNIDFEDESVDELLAKLEEKFGKPETVLSLSQINDSGLRGLVRREIRQRNAKPGEEKIYYEGLLEIKKITPSEAKEALGDIDNKVEATDLDGLSYETLKSMAKEKGISDSHRKSKAELVKLLK